MAQLLPSELTSFTLDNMGRFLCNTLQEALDSTARTVAGRRRDFDVIVIGGGTFGAVMAERLFVNDTTHSRRILVLEAGWAGTDYAVPWGGSGSACAVGHSSRAQLPWAELCDWWPLADVGGLVT